MALYEHVFLARQDISVQQVDSLVERFKGVLVESGGSVEKMENWGLRSTAYRIKKNRKAHYVMMNVDAPHEAISEMERQMRINDDVLRYMTIRVEKHSGDPSPMMKKNDNEERVGRNAPGRATPPRFSRPGFSRPESSPPPPQQSEEKPATGE